MKGTIVGKVSCRIYKYSRVVQAYLNKDIRNLLNCDDIVFNCAKLIIKRASIDSKRTHSIKSKYFTFVPRSGDLEDYIGSYNVVQVDEDTFILKKINNG